MTARLNQDPLENIFSQVRSRGGCGTNPSVSQVNSTIAKIVSMRILSFDFETKNCETDTDLMLEYVKDSFLIENEDSPDYDLQNTKEPESDVCDEDEFVEELQTQKNKSNFEVIKRYVLGFSIFKKIKCSECAKVMKKNEYSNHSVQKQSEVFIREKDFSSSLDAPFLTNPSDYFSSVFEVQFHAFTRFFSRNRHKLKLKETLLKICMKATTEKYPEWFMEQGPALISILDYILKVLINAKWRVKSSVKSVKHFSRIRHLRE